MRRVRLFQRRNLLRCQFHRQRCNGIHQMMRLSRTHDRRRDHRLTQQPRQRHLRPRHFTLLRNLSKPVDNLSVVLLGSRIHRIAKPIRL